ncbi:hypothetical protein U3A58_12905 [Algoriphagus sp. C2-6-M1]|uniref:hypothetical protein n=1 Tax=Algoriphagus persicinus TaxID=3108754 RepID=UPI002B392A14|nr:hypothetical protein [Algoriphagus sp. C2-6-M1]MEB2781293.1 hypothetical protein [Algoriphagus sp. C2-6-M1]
MKEMIIILTVLISNNFLSQDMIINCFGHNIHESLDYSSSPAQNGLFILLGIQYFSNKCFTFGAEVARVTLKDINGGTNICGAIKLGYHF